MADRKWFHVRNGLLALAAFAGVAGMTARSASAALPPSTTLQDLINDGSTGVVIGNFRYFDFSYSPSPTNGPNPAPTASNISVSNSPGSNPGLEFSSSWLAADTFNEDSIISYGVEAVDPTKSINAVALRFNGTAVVPGTATAASVTETVSTLDNGGPGTQLGQLSTYNDGTGGLPDTNTSVLVINPTQTGIFIQKDIQVHAGSLSSGGGISTISFVDNSIQVVPEPASLSLFGLAGLGLFLRRRA